MPSPVIGEIRLFQSSPGAEWMLCDGRELDIATHIHLFKVLGPKFGGDGVVRFAIPDLRSSQGSSFVANELDQARFPVSGSRVRRPSVIPSLPFDRLDYYIAVTGSAPSLVDVHVGFHVFVTHPDHGTPTLVIQDTTAGDTQKVVSISYEINDTVGGSTALTSALGETLRLNMWEDLAELDRCEPVWSVRQIVRTEQGELSSTKEVAGVVAPNSFRGAVGFGRLATGARANFNDRSRPPILQVDTLDDDASTPIVGSLRWALESNSGPRVVVFRVGGYITIDAPIRPADGQFTILAQTAPGPVVLRGDGIRDASIVYGVNNTITRHLAIRPGRQGSVPGDGDNKDAVRVINSQTHMFDHCSFTWATDGNFDTSAARDVTLSNSLVGQMLVHATHSKGSHSRNMAITVNSTRITFYQNVFCFSDVRAPQYSNCGAMAEQVRNVIRNNPTRHTDLQFDVAPGHTIPGCSASAGGPYINVVGNWYRRNRIDGVVQSVYPVDFIDNGGPGRNMTSRAYVYNNLSSQTNDVPWGRTNPGDAQSDIVHPRFSGNLVPDPFEPASPVPVPVPGSTGPTNIDYSSIPEPSGLWDELRAVVGPAFRDPVDTTLIARMDDDPGADAWHDPKYRPDHPAQTNMPNADAEGYPALSVGVPWTDSSGNGLADGFKDHLDGNELSVTGYLVVECWADELERSLLATTFGDAAGSLAFEASVREGDVGMDPHRTVVVRLAGGSVVEIPASETELILELVSRIQSSDPFSQSLQ